MTPHSQIVIGPDGTVLAATGNLPPGLVDARLEDCVALSHQIREAGKALVLRLRDSGDRLVSQTVGLDGAGHPLELLALDALAVRRTATDVRELLTSKLAVISFQAGSAGVTLGVHVADDVPSAVPLDSEKVAWAVTTLVGNALRYLQPASPRLGGKRIDVKTTYSPATSEVTVEVQDDGPGIPADTVARLFKRDGLNVRGAGLALLLIRDIMAAHGGRIDVLSNAAPVGHGTTIRLTIPAR